MTYEVGTSQTSADIIPMTMVTPGNSSEMEDLYDYYSYDYVAEWFSSLERFVPLFVVASLGVLANSAGLLLFWRFPGFTRKNPLVQNLTISDLMASIFMILSNAIYITHDGRFDPQSVKDQILCRVLVSEYLFWCASLTSTFNLTVIALERFFLIVFPLHHRRYNSPHINCIVIAAVWLTPLLVELVFLLEYDVDPDGWCFHDFHTKVKSVYAYIITNSLITFFIPLFILIVTYALIVHTLIKRNNRICPHDLGNGVTAMSIMKPSTSGYTTGQQSNGEESKASLDKEDPKKRSAVDIIPSKKSKVKKNHGFRIQTRVDDGEDFQQKSRNAYRLLWQSMIQQVMMRQRLEKNEFHNNPKEIAAVPGSKAYPSMNITMGNTSKDGVMNDSQSVADQTEKAIRKLENYSWAGIGSIQPAPLVLTTEKLRSLPHIMSTPDHDEIPQRTESYSRRGNKSERNTVKSTPTTRPLNRAQVTMTKTMIAVTGCFIICYLPFKLWNLCYLLIPLEPQNSEVTYICLVSLTLVNNCVNPFIYAIKLKMDRPRVGTRGNLPQQAPYQS